MKNFALIGASGYIAPKHMEAIKDNGGNLVAALDPCDSIGILDSYFPSCKYFSEIERFDRYINKYPVDYVVVCSPNYLHDSHCRFGLRSGADVICEKPLVLNERNLDELLEIEVKTGKKVYNVLQLRLHPEIENMIRNINQTKNFVLIEYYAPRGSWYEFSWKNDESKSGGLATNIGIHLFDLCSYLFGNHSSILHEHISKQYITGAIFFDSTEVLFELSIQMHSKPKRLININDRVFDLSNNFHNLHTDIYRNILDGKGFGIEDARESIKIVEEIRGYKNGL